MSNTTTENRRRPREEEEGEDGAERRVQPRSSATHLPSCVIGLAYRNRRHRFFMPSTRNQFCGITYPYVMVDSGCNSLLLPFPQRDIEGGDSRPDLEALAPFLGDEFKWTISSSGGTGAIGSKVLKVQQRLDNSSSIGVMQLAFARPVNLTYLRFHLGSSAADALKDHPKLLPAHKESLQDFLVQLGGRESKERSHVLLGQYYLDQVSCVQSGPVMFMLDKTSSDPIIISRVAQQCDLFATPLVESFDGFDDLEDEDHDGDDNEDRRLSWDPNDYIDG